MDFTTVAGVGGSLLSGLLGNKAQKDAIAAQALENAKSRAWATDMTKQGWAHEGEVALENWSRSQTQDAQARAFQRAMAAESSSRSRADAALANQNAKAAATLAWQRQMAADSSRVQRLVADAGKAGIHPLAALGANLNSPVASAAQVFESQGGSAPSSGGSYSGAGSSAPQSPSFSQLPFGGNPWGDAIGNAVNALSNLQSARLTEAQIRNLDAQTHATLTAARSRSIIKMARAGALGGRGSVASRFARDRAGSPSVSPPGGPRGYFGTPNYQQVAEAFGMLLGEVGGALHFGDVGLAMGSSLWDRYSKWQRRVTKAAEESPLGGFQP